jgi:tryptophanyl-tRNA synthetase
LQDEYETILIIADLHTLTTKNAKEDIEKICEHARGLVLDYLGAGIDRPGPPSISSPPFPRSTS